MEGFKLDIPGLFLEHVHHKLQVVRVGDVSGKYNTNKIIINPSH